MEAFLAATKRAPASASELQSVLDELPRRELQALGKTHGVKASLKRESLVDKLVGVLSIKLWPAQSEGGESEPKTTVQTKIEGETEQETHQAAVVEEQSAVAVAVEEKTTTGQGKNAEATLTTDDKTTDAINTTTVKKRVKVAVKKTTTVAVGKKTVSTKKGTKSSPAKLPKSTPVKATAMTPSKTMAKIHAKQISKQPTLQEHEEAKKQRAALLLSGSKFSVVKKTRSKAKEAAAEVEVSVAKTLSFGSTPAKTTAPAATKQTSKPAELTSAKKIANYKPHTGPLPTFDGDSLFSPKKVAPRAAPMAVSVMKAARVTAAKAAKTTPSKAKSTQKPSVTQSASKKKKSPTPTKKSPTKKAIVAANKENDAPQNVSEVIASSSKTAPSAKKATINKTRTTVKSTTTSVLALEAKKVERRKKFAQELKAKSTATRRQMRAATTAKNTTKTASS